MVYYVSGDVKMNSNFAERLRFLRMENTVSQKKLAEKLFVAQQTVAKWETDKSTPNPDTIAKISDFFNVSTDYLLGKTDLRNPLDIPEHIEGIADLILRMRSDDEFSDIINKINELSPEQLKAISTILSSMN